MAMELLMADPAWKEEQSMSAANEIKSHNLLDLAGKKGLIIGIANDQSIAYGCAKIMRASGAELAITYLNVKAEPHVRRLAEQLDSTIIMPCDVEQAGQLETVFKEIAQRWGKIDFVIHAIAYAPQDCLHQRIVECEKENFARAIDISCHSFVRAARLAEPLMQKGGCMVTMSYYGAEKVIQNYKIMGPVKAALESFVRYLAAELGDKGIRVHAVSPGPVKTRAASGIPHFDALIEQAVLRAPQHHLVTIEDVGTVTALLVSDGARSLTGNTIYVDAGYHVMG